MNDGIRLFEHLGTEQIKLEVTRVIESPGVTHLRYRVVKSRLPFVGAYVRNGRKESNVQYTAAPFTFSPAILMRSPKGKLPIKSQPNVRLASAEVIQSESDFL
jgi:hypothetical protein